MRQIHGVADADKVVATTSVLQGVTVSDGLRKIRLDLGASSYPADLTPEQARFIAAQLIASAKRVESFTE